MSPSSGRAAPPDPLTGLPTPTRGGWDSAAAAILRKAGTLAADAPDSDAWARLADRTIDGVTVPPLGTQSLTADLAPTGVPGAAPFTRGGSAPTGTGWDIRAALADPDPLSAALSLLAELENGSTSVALTVGPAGTALADLPTVLQDMQMDLAAVALDPRGIDPVAAGTALLAILAARASTAAAGTTLGADPLSRLLSAPAEPVHADDIAAQVTELAALARPHRIRALAVDGVAAHEAGAGEVGELAWSLAVGAHYLRVLTAAGLDSDTAGDLLGFRYAATDEQFTTMAKFRAGRLLWHRVAELSGVAPARRAQYQHAITSRPMTTRYDPWVNLLRTTVAAFAAGVGGADAVTVLPFDSALGVPEELGRRLARNISSLLISESQVGAVADPAGGAYAPEALTSALAEAAWRQFGEIEASGGVLAGLADGSIAAGFAGTAAVRRQRVASRRSAITGVTEFPHADEQLPQRRRWPETAGWDHLSWASDFEELRDHPTTAGVFLVTPGTAAAHTARATFAGNLLAAGGVRTVRSGIATDSAGLLAGFDPVATPVALLAGADADYTVDLVTALRTAGAISVLLAGRPPEQLAGLVDDQVSRGDNVLDFLQRTRNRLLAEPQPATSAAGSGAER